MDARSSQGPATSGLPRNLYFGAEDWLAQQPAIKESDLALVRNQRHNLVSHVTHKAEKLLAGLRALKDFDATGNAGSTLDHIEALRDDIAKLTTNLIRDIEQAEERFELALRVDVAHDRAPQPPTTAGPKPGPGPVIVVVHDTPLPSTKPLLTDQAFAHMKAKKDLERIAAGNPSIAAGRVSW
jgi:hypothetical protein